MPILPDPSWGFCVHRVVHDICSSVRPSYSYTRMALRKLTKTKPTSRSQSRKTKGLPTHLTPGNPGNSGGKKERSGRTSNWLKRFARRMVKSPSAQKSVRAIIRQGSRNPAFVALLKEYHTRGWGNEVQGHELSVSLEDLVAPPQEIR